MPIRELIKVFESPLTLAQSFILNLSQVLPELCKGPLRINFSLFPDIDSLEDLALKLLLSMAITFRILQHFEHLFEYFINLGW